MERTEIATSISGIKPCEARRFVGELVPTVLLVLAWLIICFLILSLIDPYGVIGWPQIAGINAVKPLQSANARIYKPFALLKGDYNGIVLGASRELRGIEPKSALLVGAGYRLYNFGVVDERPYESEEIAEFAVNRMAIKTLIFDASSPDTTPHRSLLSGTSGLFIQRAQFCAGRSISIFAQQCRREALKTAIRRSLPACSDSALSDIRRKVAKCFPQSLPQMCHTIIEEPLTPRSHATLTTSFRR